jgi:uncharacterized cupin superfamily protein
VIVRWEDVELGADIGPAAGARDVSLHRVRIEPDQTAAQVDAPVEEIVYVLEGAGTWETPLGRAPVGPGDVGVRRAEEEGHLLRAGPDGLLLFAFVSPLARKLITRPTARAPQIVNVDSVEADYEGDVGTWAPLARHAGAVRGGLNFGYLAAGHAGAPPHCHSAEEEVFVVLEGSGTIELWPAPARADDHERTQHALRAGDVAWRPPATGIAHLVRASDQGMSFLVYGTREPGDVCYYPRSNKIFWRGAGLISRLEPLDYDDGEPED